MGTRFLPGAWHLYDIGTWSIYETDEHSKPDARKLNWFAINRSCEELRHFDLSPNIQPNFLTFFRLVLMDFPTRTGLGPLNHADVERLWNIRQSRFQRQRRVG